MKKVLIAIMCICCFLPTLLVASGKFTIQNRSGMSTMAVIIGPMILPDLDDNGITFVDGGSSADYSSSNLSADTPYANGALRAYSSLGIYNNKRDTTYSSFKYLSFCRYFRLYRNDGRPIYDDDGILDVTWDKTTTNEVVNYPSYLQATYTTLPSNNKGFLWTTLQARLKNGNWNVTYYNDSTTLGSVSKGLPTNPSNTRVTLPTIMEKNFTRSYSNSNLFSINVGVTGYWENTFWGGTGDNTWISENTSGYITVASRDWSNSLVASSGVGTGSYNGKTAYYSPKDFTVRATNLNNYVAINDVQATPKYGTSVVPFRDGHHIDISGEGYTKVDIENGGENVWSTYYCFVDTKVPTVSYTYHNSNAMDKRVVGTITTDSLGAKSQTINEGTFKDQVQVNFSYDINKEAPVSATYTYNGQTKPITSGTWLSDEGDYIITLSDLAGNKTISKFRIDKSYPNYNLNRLKTDKSYKIARWYLTTIPYGYSNSGTYSFASFDEALSLAKTAEFSKCVSTYTLNNIEDFTNTNLLAEGETPKVGEYYYYKSKHNPTLYVYYFDKQKLNEVIELYAKDFVSEAQTYKINSTLTPNNYGNTIDSKVINNLILGGYIANNFTFKYQDDNDTYLIYCDYQEDNKEEWKQLVYNIPFTTQVNSNGLYKIKEVDYVGHETYYFVYLDLNGPMIDIEVKNYGKDKILCQTISSADIPNNGELIYYYETFKITQVIENDVWWTMEIKCPDGTTKRYTYLDELPNFEDFGSGEFTITVADRVNNNFKFKVFLLGTAPSVKFETVNANTQLKMTISSGESYNTITDIKIYRNGVCLNSENGYDEKPNDDSNELIYINPNTLKYTFSKGGIYIVELTDNFGRTLSYDYKFEKDLPQGTLVGVTHGGKTKDQVKFMFDSNKYFVVVSKEGLSYTAETEVNKNITTLIFNPEEDSEIDYSIQLVDFTDTENYNIYNFTIKTIKPIINLFGVEPNGRTGRTVYATWDTTEEQYTAYLNINGKIETYRKGQILSAEGNYTITLSDEIGNKNSVSFEIDKSVNFAIADVQGNLYEIEDIRYINFDVRLIEKEPLVVNVSKDNKSIQYEFGLMITEEGEYLVQLVDEFENTLFFTFTIDKTPPTATLYGVEEYGVTNKSAWICSSETGLTCWYVRDEEYRDVYQLGQELTTHGKYKVFVADRAKNYISFEFEIDKEVAYDINTYCGGISNGKVRLVAYENLKIVMYKDGKPIEYNFEDTLNEEGEYAFTIIDDLGNKTSSFFNIITKRKQNLNHILQENISVKSVVKDDENYAYEVLENKLYLHEEGKYVVNIIDTKTNKEYSFEITLDTTAPTLQLVNVENGGTTKKVVIMKNISETPTEHYITVDGAPFDYTMGDEIEKCGRFEVVLEDEAGNITTYTFERLYSLNGPSIAVLAGLGALVVLLIVLLIKSRHRYYTDVVEEEIEETVIDDENAENDDGEDENTEND